MKLVMHVNDDTHKTLRKMESACEMWEPTNDVQQAHTLQALVN
jgi:hypothetical protein